MTIPQEDTDDASWEGAPVANVTNIATESEQQSTTVDKVFIEMADVRVCFKT